MSRHANAGRTLLIATAVLTTAMARADDGVQLIVNHSGEAIELSWIGGDPRFDVYRSSDPARVLEATSRVGGTTERSFSDDPPPGGVHFYRVQQRATCYHATEDATVDSLAATTNFADDPTLRVGDQTGDQRSYLRYSLDPFPPNARIQSATIELPYSGTASSSIFTRLHAAAAAWDADTVTYANQPGLGSQSSANSSATDGPWRRHSVTGLVQGWIDGTQPNNGVAVVADQGVTAVVFHSIDAAVAERPRLCVDWLEPQAQGLARLADGVDRVKLDEDGRVTFLTGSFPIDTPVSDDPVTLALQFLSDNAMLYGIEDPQAELFLDRYSADGLFDTVVFGQRHPDRNIPYFASNLIVLLEKGQPWVRATVGRFERNDAEFVTPPVSAQDAAQIASEYLGAGSTVRGDVLLNEYSSDLLLSDGGGPRLHWRMIVEREDALAETYEELELFVDALTGEVTLEMALGEDHTESLDLAILGNDGPDEKCGELGGTELFDEDGPTADYASSLDPSSEAADAREWAQTLWDMVHDRYDYAGWDDGSMQVRIAMGQDKTQSRRRCGGIKFEYDWLVDDILAHEWMHMIDHHTAELYYRHESGAIDEAFADIFGMGIDPEDWQLGEDIVNCDSPDACGCARRDLSDPPLCGPYVDHMDDFLTGSWDNHRVHGNSSIINKAFYLMVDGGTHRGTTVAPVSRPRVEDLFWMTHVGIKQFGASILTKNTTFLQLANALLFWADLMQFNANETCQVINALHAVGLMAPDADCDGRPDQGPDTDNDGVDRQNDNCPTVSNPSQQDTDGDLVGDVCDLDIDGDGIDNVDDNCVYVSNPSQTPGSPGKSIGIACLDSDRDRVFDYLDNCPEDRNGSQLDLDLDGVGDVCDPDVDGDGILNDDDPCPRNEGGSGRDSDGDGYADACDNCPGIWNPQQVNHDFDTLGDACDSDLDGDGVPQGDGTNPCQGPQDSDCDDNCPTIRNHDQTDGDGDGIGQRCDTNELLELSAQRNELVEANVLVAMLAGDVARFEITPCREDCPDWLTDDFWTRVSLNANVPLDARIVDERGFVVTQRATNAAGDVELQFDVAPEFHYRSPALDVLPYRGGSAEEPVQLKTYLLELRLAPGVAEAGVDAVIVVESNFPAQ